MTHLLLAHQINGMVNRHRGRRTYNLWPARWRQVTTSPIESVTSPSLPTLMFCKVFSLRAHGLRQRGQNSHAPCQGACEFRHGARRSLQRRENTLQNTTERMRPLQRQPEACQAQLPRASRAAKSTGPSAAVKPEVRTGRAAHSPPTTLICHHLSPPLRHPTAGTCLP